MSAILVVRLPGLNTKFSKSYKLHFSFLIYFAHQKGKQFPGSEEHSLFAVFTLF